MPDALRSSATVSLAVFGSRVLGLFREVVFAALFGAGAIADAFHVAYRIPNLLRDLFAEGALSAAFVPTFTAALHDEGEARAHALGNLVGSALLVLTGALVVLGVVFADPIVYEISDGFAGDADKVALAAELTRVMMPLLSVVSLSAVWMGMLNARRRFVVPAIAPAMFNVVSLSAGVVVWAVGGTALEGVFIWAIGTLVAGVMQALVQLPSLWRLGFRPRLVLRGVRTDPGVRRIAKLMTPALVGVAAIQINVFINTKFAGSLGDGAVAQLTYAFRLFFLPLGVFGVALATVTTTHVAEEAAKGDHEALLARSGESISVGWMLTSASAVGLFVLAEPVCTLVYRHGQTSAADVAAIAWVLRAYVCGLVPYAMVKIVAPAFYSIDRPRVPLLASVSAVAANLTFNALTYRELGPPGIAIGTGIGALVNITILRLSLRKIVGKLPGERRVGRGLGLLLANVAMGGAVFGLHWVAAPWLPADGGLGGTAMLGAALLVLISVGFVVFAGIAQAFGYPGADALWKIPNKLVRR